MAIKDLTKAKFHLFLCNGGSCKNLGAEESTKAIRNIIQEEGIDSEVHTTKTLCNGRCNDGPIVIVEPDNIWYKNITADIAEKLVKDHLMEGNMLEDHLLYEWGSATIYDAAPILSQTNHINT